MNTTAEPLRLRSDPVELDDSERDKVVPLEV